MRDVWPGISELALSNDAPVLVLIPRDTSERAGDRVKNASQGGGGFLPAPIELTIATATKLIALRCVNSPQSNARAVNLDRISVNYACAADDILCSRERLRKQNS
ncbi:hypothetical protein IQ16_01749 [Bradyrhizobium huanghuaihaiense]|uniref:Uncharacterized protein n=1 Tax=Bradyrhizobium huanghuaihaiense TaxID=990078 RepID=A0A562RWZ1_9BRAD|nr:hypothetical protein IQ16_01749 [Bradyrhizobium huanghuaihaiense]